MRRMRFKEKTRKKPVTRKCDEGCPCEDAGFLQVINDGQFRTPKGNVLPDKTVPVLCNGPKGEWIRLHSNKMRLPTYDPETMRLVGEEEKPIPEREVKPVQNQLF